jgi:molybdate transport repressor ModE-like protein
MTPAEKMQKWSNIHCTYNFCILTEDGHIALSDERLQLLIAIIDCGTLRDAAKSMGISYRKAWGAIHETETLVGLPLIEAHSGGKVGGHTTLTAEGKKLVEAYKVLLSDFQASASDCIRKFKRTLKEK